MRSLQTRQGHLPGGLRCCCRYRNGAPLAVKSTKKVPRFRVVFVANLWRYVDMFSSGGPRCLRTTYGSQGSTFGTICTDLDAPGPSFQDPPSVADLQSDEKARVKILTSGFMIDDFDDEPASKGYEARCSNRVRARHQLTLQAQCLLPGRRQGEQAWLLHQSSQLRLRRRLSRQCPSGPTTLPPLVAQRYRIARRACMGWIVLTVDSYLPLLIQPSFSISSTK